VLALVLILGVVFFASTNPLNAQQNGTSNMASIQQGQQNQTTGIGTASEIENFTGGNISVLGNETDIQSQNDTSVTEGMQQEQVTTDTNLTSN
jgi:preprotein translocase subunit YajC